MPKISKGRRVGQAAVNAVPGLLEVKGGEKWRRANG